MKILIITSIFPYSKNLQYGTFVKDQVDSLRNNFANEIEIDVHFINGSESILNYLRSLFSLPKIIRKEQYDIAHVHYGLTLISTLFMSIPVVVTFHGSDLFLWYVKMVSKLMQFKVSKNIVVSKKLKKEVPTSTVIPCGIDVSMFQYPDRELLHYSYNKNKLDHLVILFPANPKNKVKNYPLFDKVCKCFEQNGIKIKRLHLTNIKREEVPKIFWKSDLMILTSFREGSPTVIKEAIASKLPFVSVDVGDVHEWIDCIDFGSISKNFDPDEIANNAIELLKRIPLRSDLDNSKAILKISDTEISKKIKAIYDSIVHSTNAHIVTKKNDSFLNN